jgi:hypothetical protein
LRVAAWAVAEIASIRRRSLLIYVKPDAARNALQDKLSRAISVAEREKAAAG